MADDKNLSGHYELATWYMHEGRRLPPGSRVLLSHEDAERLLAQKVAKACDPPAQEEDLSGDYILKYWHMQPVDGDPRKLERIRPGKPARLSHEDVKRMKAQGLIVRKAEASDYQSEEPEAASGESPAVDASQPDAPAQDAKASKSKAAKKAPKAKADEPPSGSDGQSSAS